MVSFKVRDEMTFGLKAHNIDPAEFDERVQHALELVNMLDVIDAEIFDLGKGQKQRLAIASVLTLNPQILVIDEPTTGQDPQMTKEIFDIIKTSERSGHNRPDDHASGGLCCRVCTPRRRDEPR